jgi:hypothetical protein
MDITTLSVQQIEDLIKEKNSYTGKFLRERFKG